MIVQPAEPSARQSSSTTSTTAAGGSSSPPSVRSVASRKSPAARARSTRSRGRVLSSSASVVFDVTLAGDDDLPMAGRDFIAEIQAEPDAARKIALYFGHLASVAPAVTPVQLLARDAVVTAILGRTR